MPKLYTIREIAQELNVPFWRVRYAVAESGIQPVQRLGIVRIFAAEQIPQIRIELERTGRQSARRKELAAAL